MQLRTGIKFFFKFVLKYIKINLSALFINCLFTLSLTLSLKFFQYKYSILDMEEFLLKITVTFEYIFYQCSIERNLSGKKSITAIPLLGPI